MLTSRSQIVAGLVFLCWVLPAWAQPGPPPGGFPGGFGPPPQPGEVLPKPLQDRLKLSAAQKQQLAELQKDLDAKLADLLTAEQNKSLSQIRQGKGGIGGGQPGMPGGGPGGAPPGGVPGGALPKGGFGPMPGFGGFGGNRNENVQKKIDATDEEWKVIGPKLQQVIAARRALNGENTSKGPFGGGGSNVVAQAQADLKAVLDEPKHTKAEAEEKIAAIRKARETARTNLEDAQRDLMRLLTPSQQVIMISLGHLD
jgi:Spy/CpxP family protein refolding chaperone